MRDEVNVSAAVDGISCRLRIAAEESNNAGPYTLFRSAFLWTLGVAASVSGCGGSSYSSSVGPNGSATGAAATVTAPTAPPSYSGTPAVPGANDAVVATPSTAAVSAVVGATQTLSIAFTSSDGRLITGFGVLGATQPLPDGWSAPDNFVCASVANGSSCVINVTYAPTAAANGTLVLDYVFISNAAQPKTGGSVSIAYNATPSDNVIGSALPTGQINAVAGAGSRAVAVSFVTDDGNPATDFQVSSDLTQLPAGWSSAQSALTCPIIATGNGCVLALQFAPAAASRGSLTLTYTYTDDAGVGKTGSVVLPYASSTANTVTATSSPGTQITAVKNGGGKAVSLTFTTDDGKPASELSITSDLTQLPNGWSSAAATFACATLAAGNGCQLQLTYAPAQLASGTLGLRYTYKDSGGTLRNGLVDLGFAATSSDSVDTSVAPSGEITAVAADGLRQGNGTQAVAVVFGTDDHLPATDLQVTAGLLLPPGWSGPSNFACAGVDLVTPCHLALSYTPVGAAAGTVLLNYSYRNNAGAPQGGSVSIGYRATTNNNISVAATPVALTGRTGSSANVVVAFTTDDGNPVTALSLGGLASLPPGWSGPGTFSCATVSAAASCSMTLTYAPTVAAMAATLTLPFTFTNDAGYAVTGNVTIPYSAITPYAYVTNRSANTVSACPLRADNTLGACFVTGSGFNGPAAIALHGNYAYVSNELGASVSQCVLASAGVLSGCSDVLGFIDPTYLAIGASGTAYLNQNGDLAACAIAASNGALSACNSVGAAFDPLTGVALAADGSVYSVHTDTSIPASPSVVLDHCPTTAGGAFAACTTSPAPLAAAALAFENGAVYLSTSNGAIYVCPATVAGACALTAVNSQATALAFMMTPSPTAFLSTGTRLLECPVLSDGTFGTCAAFSDPTFNAPSGVAIRYP